MSERGFTSKEVLAILNHPDVLDKYRCTAEQDDPDGVGPPIRCTLIVRHPGQHSGIRNTP